MPQLKWKDVAEHGRYGSTLAQTATDPRTGFSYSITYDHESNTYDVSEFQPRMPYVPGATVYPQYHLKSDREAKAIVEGWMKDAPERKRKAIAYVKKEQRRDSGMGRRRGSFR